MKMGMSVHDAVDAAVEDMRALQGGLIARITIHAIDAQDRWRVVAVNGTDKNRYWLWRNGEPNATSQPSEIIPL